MPGAPIAAVHTLSGPERFATSNEALCGHLTATHGRAGVIIVKELRSGKLADLTASQPRNPNFEYVLDANGAKTNVVRTTTTNNVETRVTRTPDKTEKIMYAAAIKLYAAYVEEVMALRVRAF